MITCPKCEDVEMDWVETVGNENLSLSTYSCPLCTLEIKVNWSDNDKG